MVIQSRKMFYVYAGLLGLLVGMLSWLVFPNRATSEHAPALRPVLDVLTNTVLIDGKPISPTAFRALSQWHLEKIPTKDAIDGYVLRVHSVPIVVDDQDKNLPAWSRLITATYLMSDEDTIIAVISKIADQESRALALLSLMPLLRTGSVPADPVAPSITNNPPLFPSFEEPAPPPRILSSGTALPKSKSSLPANAVREQEVKWRSEIESIRRGVLKTLDGAEKQASMLDDSELKANVYLSVAENYSKLLEESKANKALDSASLALQNAFKNANSLYAYTKHFTMTYGFSIVAGIITILSVLLKDQLTKASAYAYTNAVLMVIKDEDLAKNLGAKLRKSTILQPYDQPESDPKGKIA
jgi:hypothetical protein